MQSGESPQKSGRIRTPRVQTLTQCALMAAILCVLSPWAIPAGTVPLSLSLLVVLLAGILQGPWTGTCAVVLYLFIGAIGLPVFSGGTGGFAMLVGPTGGYLWSYPLAALLAGLLSRPVLKKDRARIPRLLVALLPSVAVCYLFGTLQLGLVSHLSLRAALALGVLPFLPFDLIKCAAVAVLGGTLHRRLRGLQK